MTQTFAGLEITTPDAIMHDWGWCVGLFGKAGIGKTTLLATIANSKHAGKLFYVDCQGGPHVLAGQKLDISVVRPDKFSELDSLNKALLASINTRQERTFIFDHVTEMQKMHLRSMSTASNREWKHYTRSQEWLEKFVRDWCEKARDYGVNVIFVFQEDKDQEEDTKRWIYRFGLSPHIANELPYLLDYVGYVALVNERSTERYVSFAPSNKYASKIRRPMVGRGSEIPLVVYHPDLGVILDVMKGDASWPVHFNTPRTKVRDEKKDGEKDSSAEEKAEEENE